MQCSRKICLDFLGLYESEEIEIYNTQLPCLVWVGGFTFNSTLQINIVEELHLIPQTKLRVDLPFSSV